jgi:Holliday junction resolvase RusA-like endonuclease
VFEATFPIKAKAWKRAGMDSRRPAGQRSYLPTDMKVYYQQLYWAFVRAGLKPLGQTVEYGGEIEFHFKDRRWRDTSNLLKSLEDAGQPSKYMNQKELKAAFMPDLWDDKIFADWHIKRVRGSDGDRIVVRIWKL